MASRQSVSSILKPPKVRPPLKEIEPVDQDTDENTATISKRKVSFSGMNKIKMYNTGATSLTVHQTPMFDEQLLSDSSNAEKTNLSGKFDGLNTFESTNCTDVVGNGRVIIEYESPSDNMEMTEAIIGKISSDTIYGIDNNVSEHINYSSDYSANNMEFTEAIKGGKIFNTGIESNLSVIEMSETLNNTCNEQPKTQLDLQSSVSLPNIVDKKMSDISLYSSNMEFTEAIKGGKILNTDTESNLSVIEMSETLNNTCNEQPKTQLDLQSSVSLPNIVDKKMSDISLYSSNMEFTEAIKGGKILNTDTESNLSVIEMSETLNNTCNEQSKTLFDLQSSVSLPNIVEKKMPDISLFSSNMEFTEAIKGGKILNTDTESNLSVIEMSENLNNTCNEQPKTQLDLQFSASLPNMVEKKNPNISSYSSNMNFTCDNIKRNSMDLTCMTGISSKSIWLSDDNKSYSMVLPESPDRQNLDENYELVYDCSMESEASCEINQNSNCEPQIVYDCMMEPDVSTELNENSSCDSHVLQNAILYTKKSETNNYSNLKNSSNDNEIVELLSMSMVSMDIDPTSESNEYDINCVAANNLESDVNKQKMSLVPITIGIENNGYPVESSQYEIDNYKNNKSRTSMASTGSSFIQEVSPEKNVNTSIIDQEVLQEQNISCANASVVDNNVFISDTSIVIEENKTKNYSRKTMIHTGSLIDQEKSSAIDDISGISIINEANQQKICPRKSVAPTCDLNETRSFENKSTMSDTSVAVEENQQEVYSRKSIAPTSDINQTQFFENEDMSNTSVYRPIQSNEDLPDTSPKMEEFQQKVYFRKSVAPTFDLNQTSSYENEGIMSDNSGVVEEIQQKVYSRKSIAPTSDVNQIEFFENEDMSNTSISRPTQSYLNEAVPDKFPRVEENHQKICSRKSVAPTFDLNHTNSYENEGIMTDNSVVVEEIQQKVYSRKSVAPTFDLNHTNSYENEGIMTDNSVVVEEIQQKVYSRKSVAPTFDLNHTNSYENEGIMTDSSVIVEENQQKKEDSFIIAEENQVKRYSRKSVGPTSISPQNESPKDNMSDNDNSLLVKDNNKVPVFVNNLSLTSNDSNIQQINLSDQNKGQIFLENEYQSSLLNTSSDDDCNSPFMKKSRKSVGPKYLTKKLVHTKYLDVEYKSETINENNFIDNFDQENKMDISIENESKNENNILIQEKSMILSSPLNEISIIKNVFHSSHSSVSENQNVSSLMNDSVKQNSKDIDVSFHKNNSNQFFDISNKVKEHDTNYVIGGEYEIGKETVVMATNELKHKDETNLIQPVKNNKILKECGRTNNEETDNQLTQSTDDICNIDFVLTSTSYTSKHSIDKITNNVCLNDTSNMSTSKESHQHVEKSLIGNRKRSYSNRVGAPLLCSSFISKPNIHNCTNEEFPREDCLNGSSINKTDTTKNNSVNKDSVIDNAIVVDPIKEKSVEENMSNTVVEFLSRWNEQFIENILILDKCTNSEWIFNILDNNIILIISYSPIVNNDSFLKVADISFTTKIISQNEILKFGINWILSKYNPKMYKQICFTSRDIELLLKSLLVDVQFIRMVMKNMFFICDAYCVTCKDNKVQFILHNMNPCPLMARIEISLSNIHKISIKDITVDSLFGFFNTKELDGIMESVTKDCNVLQSIIEKIRKIYLHR